MPTCSISIMGVQPAVEYLAICAYFEIFLSIYRVYNCKYDGITFSAHGLTKRLFHL
ncbi:hypothetical protein SAMN05216604_11173 [Pseudomonas agarici]|nr:hypothetical protein SAMN05216604_11173 [Pseudomonas agarici]